MKNAIVVFGSSVNPPHFAHKYILELLSKNFSKVIFLPAGARQDKQLLVGNHRKEMINIFFNKKWLGNHSNVSIDYSDINGKNTPTLIYLEKLRKDHPNEKTYFCIGSDLLFPKEKFAGKSEIESSWYEGKRLLKEFNIMLLARPAYDLSKIKNLSSYHTISLENELPDISSSQIREMIKNGESVSQCISKDLLSYIEKQQLYK